MPCSLIVIVGPTAIGKTSLSISLAEYFKTEIISADSRQIFKELNAGTAKPDDDQLYRVKHHFIGSKSIFEPYDASKFEFEVLDLLKSLFKKYKSVILAGGSGLYVDAVCKGIDDIPSPDREIRNSLIRQYQQEGIESLRLLLKKLDPGYYSKADLKNQNRIIKALEISIMTGKPYSSFLTNKQKDRAFNIIKVGISCDRDILYQRINKRVDEMINNGLYEEAKTLYPLFKEKGINALKTVGYKELFDAFDGKISLNKAIELIKRNTRRYAKRQLTWFQRDKEIEWFEAGNRKSIIEYIEKKC